MLMAELPLDTAVHHAVHTRPRNRVPGVISESPAPRHEERMPNQSQRREFGRRAPAQLDA